MNRALDRYKFLPITIFFLIICLTGFSQVICPKENFLLNTGREIIYNRTNPLYTSCYIEEINELKDIGFDFALENFLSNMDKCLQKNYGSYIDYQESKDGRFYYSSIYGGSFIVALKNKFGNIDSVQVSDASLKNSIAINCFAEIISPIVGGHKESGIMIAKIMIDSVYEGDEVVAVFEPEPILDIPTFTFYRNPNDPAFDIIGKNCDLNYARACVPISKEDDLNCSDIPYSNFRVIGVDHHNLDGDNNGIACEPYIP